MKVVQARSDFRKLWTRLRSVYSLAGKHRMVAVLDNHQGRKETICRKLGVISDMDINRISTELKARGHSKTKPETEYR